MLYYCDMVRWAWLDWGRSGWLTTLLQCFDTAGWIIRFVKHLLQNDLNCDKWDVKPCSTVTLGAVYLGVQMSDAIGCRVGQLQHRDDAQNVLSQVVVKWSVLMVVSNQKHLGPWSGTLDVSRYEPYQTASSAWYHDITITLWRPLLPYRYSYKASCARPG